jgi:hypothetical protein
LGCRAAGAELLTLIKEDSRVNAVLVQCSRRRWAEAEPAIKFRGRAKLYQINK